MTGAATTDLTDGDLETLRAGDLSEDLRARVYQELRRRRYRTIYRGGMKAARPPRRCSSMQRKST